LKRFSCRFAEIVCARAQGERWSRGGQQQIGPLVCAAGPTGRALDPAPAAEAGHARLACAPWGVPSRRDEVTRRIAWESGRRAALPISAFRGQGPANFWGRIDPAWKPGCQYDTLCAAVSLAAHDQGLRDRTSAARHPIGVSTATLVQLLLPLHDGGGHPYPSASFLRIRQELSRLFGGITAYCRAPPGPETVIIDPETQRGDDFVVYEVMAPRLEPGWWHAYRSELERRFQQGPIVVRAQAVEVL
jgi:hypothetical protein